MKTAISIEDQVFESAEAACKELGLSRSALYSRAVQEFVEYHLPGKVTERYNEAHGGDSALPNDLKSVSSLMLSRVDW